MSSDTDYNPRSHDAMFTKILGKLDAQAHESAIYRSELKETLTAIKSGVDRTNGRVTALEREKWVQRGFVAAISLAGTAVWQWWTGHK